MPNSDRFSGLTRAMIGVTLAVLMTICILPTCLVGAGGGYLPDVRCLSNIKALTLATHIYAEDNDMRLPPATTWMDATYPYCKMNYHCPSLSGDNQYGYAFNKAHEGALFLEDSDSRFIYESSKLHRNANEYVPLFPDPPRHAKGIAVGSMNSKVTWRR